MALDAKSKDMIATMTASIAGGAVAMAASALVMNGLKQLTVTSRHKQSLTGTDNTDPTESKKTLSSSSTTGEQSEQSLSQQSTTANKENVDANENGVEGVSNSSNASTNEASAMGAEAGAMDTSTQGLRMS